MRFIKTISYFARKILYLWIKTEVLPTDSAELNIKSDYPAIYLLESRAWSSLWVLETECKRMGLPSPMNRLATPQLNSWHSVYTVAPRQPFKTWLQKQPKRSRMLRGIVQILRESPELEIQFIPVSIFWGRPVVVTKHWLQILFADSWKVASRLRKFFTILFNGRSTFVKYSEVYRYKIEANANESDDEIIDRLQSKLAEHLTGVRAATLGPDMSHRNSLVRTLLLKPDVQAAIHKRSMEDGRSEIQSTIQAKRYLNEIVANCTSTTINVMQRGLRFFWNRFYSGIQVSNSENLKKLALTHELIYVPCHRSHIDYLLLSYVIYYEGLAIPYIAAGKNLNMPLIGSILRGGGAFFIRRSFKGNELYSTVMFEYIAELVSKGVPIEYFIEGGRSRTGRLLKPKPGMLSMTIRGFLKYREKPIAFIPVYIGYEKLMESKAYQAELSGEDKKSETFLNSIHSIFRIRGNFGKVHTNFGEPVFLTDILDCHYPLWISEHYNDAQRPIWLRTIVNNVSEDIMCRINQSATVNSINLVATVLLATNKQNMDERELEHMLELYRIIILSLDYSKYLIISNKSGKQQIEHAESLKMVRRRKHELGDIIFLDAKHSISLTYYRNNILHLVTLPSIIACCFFNKRTLPKDEIVQLITLAYPFLKTEMFLVWNKEELPDVIFRVLEIMSLQGILVKNNDNTTYSRRGSGTVQFNQLNLLAKAISPTLEVYYLTLAILSRAGNKTIAKQELEKKCQLMAQRIGMIYELNSPDYYDKNLISNFIDTLIHIDYVKVFEANHLAYSEVFKKADKKIRFLLSKKIRANILQMLRQST